MPSRLALSIIYRIAAAIVLFASAIAVGGATGTANAAPRAITFVCGDSQTPQVMVDVDGTFAYRNNSWQSPQVGRMLKFQCYPALGRDYANEWILVPYGSTRAWVNRSAVRFADGMDISQLPSADQVPPAPPPHRMRLPGLPTVSRKMQQLYRDAVRAGRNPAMMALIGDCNSEHPVYFGRLAAGAFDLTPYPELQGVARTFAPSFNRVSVATSGSFNATMAFDPTWSDPKQCKRDEGPLACELRLSNASLLLVSLGTGDTFTWRDFEANYKAIIEYALARKIVPLLMTKADALETKQGGAPADYINGVVRKLGAQYGVPVIDFALAARQLPNGGLAIERNDNLQTIEPFHVNEVGMDARILLTLQTLAQFPSVNPPSRRR
ncbi:MAG: SGNH/GDSL hydrolase family protein [Thermoflexales bacterium]|nr:SGNH/GDSL hydrolase family protein [Thermoflexales bacterium]MDW8352758.1 SGNH/GDSL hydrolase family protein [Anaerolineae bacterium]